MKLALCLALSAKLSVEDEASKLRTAILGELSIEPALEQKLEENSARIFDLVSGLLNDYRLDFRKAVVPQLIWWDLFQPMERTEATVKLNGLYTELSLSVHEYLLLLLGSVVEVWVRMDDGYSLYS